MLVLVITFIVRLLGFQDAGGLVALITIVIIISVYLFTGSPNPSAFFRAIRHKILELLYARFTRIILLFANGVFCLLLAISFPEVSRHIVTPLSPTPTQVNSPSPLLPSSATLRPTPEPTQTPANQSSPTSLSSTATLRPTPTPTQTPTNQPSPTSLSLSPVETIDLPTEYSLPCEVSVKANLGVMVPLYASPTSTEITAEMNEGVQMTVIGKTIIYRNDSEQEFWWKLANGYWVNSTNVQLSGDCENMPLLDDASGAG
jgi:hypothetical protein